MSQPTRADQRVHPLQVARILPDYLIADRAGVTVWWSNIKREGEWLLPRLFRAFAFMGNVELDLTTARLGPDVSEIEIRCILANVEIKVPRDIRVLCDGDGLAGSFDVKRVGDTTPPFDAPTLRVTGSVYLGNVTVTIVGPIAPGEGGLFEKLKAGWDSINC